MSEPIRVLHVDDDPEFVDVAAEFLERADERLTVVAAASTSEGLEKLSDHDVDCVVSDYDMPGESGLQFLEAVRAEYPDLPFVLFTGKGSEEIASEAISAGVTDYLQKERGSDQYAVLANRIARAVEADRSRRALAERTRRLETLISNLPGLVYRCRNERGWPIERVEGDVEDVTGYPVESLESGEVSIGEDLIHPEDRDRVWRTIQDALAAEDSFEVTYRIVTADGDERWLWERGSGVYDADGELEALEGFVTDATDRRERKRELERERDRFVTLFENLPNPVVHGSALEEGPIVERVNPAFERVFGYDAEAVVGENLDDLTVPEDRRDEARTLNERVAEGGSLRTEVECLTADGLRDFLLSVVVHDEPEGQSEGYAIYTDITERKERERALQVRTRAIEEATDGIAILEDDEYVFVNRAHAEVYGYDDPEAFLGESWTMCYDDAETERFEREVYPRFLEQGSWRGEATGRRKDGSMFPQELSLTLLDENRIVCVVRDITERKERERELERKNERLDEFASIVSHDLRNPLSVARGHLDLAREDHESDHLETVADALDRSTRIVEGTLSLARSGRTVGDREPVALEPVVEDCWTHVETDSAAIRVAELPAIAADPDGLRHVVENLFRNAIEHGGEDVTVRVGPCDGGFYVEDDGVGLPDDDPFDGSFRDGAAGDGIGLAIVRRIVDAHGWAIEATEGRDGGVRFEITGVDEVEPGT